MTDLNFIKEHITSGTLSKEKEHFLLDECRWTCYSAPRGTGKTTLLGIDVICTAFNRKGDYVVIVSSSATMVILKLYIQAILDEYLIDLRSCKLHSSAETYILPNGSSISFTTVNRLDFYGRRIDGAFIDEASLNNNDILNLRLCMAHNNNCFIKAYGTNDEDRLNFYRSQGFSVTVETRDSIR